MTSHLASTSTSVTPSPLKILLAEDHPVNQKVALLLLKKCGYQADVVVNGKAVLEALAKCPYQVILMDVQMPEIGGIQATQQIHQQYDSEQWPYIIALTASVTQGDHDDCLAAGMQAFLTKPIQVQALKAALMAAEEHFSAITPTGLTANPKVTLLPNNDSPLLDTAVLDGIRTLAGEAAPIILADLVEDFLADIPGNLNGIQTAIAQQDPEVLRQWGHRLRSSCANLGAAALSDLGHQLEDHGKAGTFPDAAATASHLQNTYGETAITLRTWVTALRNS